MPNEEFLYILYIFYNAIGVSSHFHFSLRVVSDVELRRGTENILFTLKSRVIAYKHEKGNLLNLMSAKNVRMGILSSSSRCHAPNNVYTKDND